MHVQLYHSQRGSAKQRKGRLRFQKETCVSCMSLKPKLDREYTFCTIDNLHEMTQYAKNRSKQFRVGGSPMPCIREIYIRFWNTKSCLILYLFCETSFEQVK